jgi:hypothetical protein
LKTAVRILRGRFAGREGWISGDLESRAARGITRALVHVDGELPDLFATSSLESATQLLLPIREPA